MMANHEFTEYLDGTWLAISAEKGLLGRADSRLELGDLMRARHPQESYYQFQLREKITIMSFSSSSVNVAGSNLLDVPTTVYDDLLVELPFCSGERRACALPID